MEIKPKKDRIDAILVMRGLAESREKARALIMAGEVAMDGVVIDKPGREILVDSPLEVRESMPYVSRGGLKLAAGLDAFGVDPSGLTILDGGASTGGFTHCLLLRGAARVVAVDVGYGQFHWSLRNDPRVHLLERTNFRYLEPSAVLWPIDAAVADLSFISLRLILPKLRDFVPQSGWVVVLVKPQFEVGRADVHKGVVRDPDKIRSAVEGIKAFAEEHGYSALGETESPIKGPKGNREFLVHLKVR
jgi:23S rRNA (cytidine1920-2'-O)/16S rRNA (cytidine1409-2'-O)-methyltransferase